MFRTLAAVKAAVWTCSGHFSLLWRPLFEHVQDFSHCCEGLCLNMFRAFLIAMKAAVWTCSGLFSLLWRGLLEHVQNSLWPRKLLPEHIRDSHCREDCLLCLFRATSSHCHKRQVLKHVQGQKGALWWGLAYRMNMFRARNSRCREDCNCCASRVTGADGRHLLLLQCCLMSSDVGWHVKDKLRPMRQHGSI